MIYVIFSEIDRASSALCATIFASVSMPDVREDRIWEGSKAHGLES